MNVKSKGVLTPFLSYRQNGGDKLAKDGTLRGGARAGSGRKSNKTPPPLIDFGAVRNTEAADFSPETDKKSASKGRKKAVSDTDTTAKSRKKSAAQVDSSKKAAKKTAQTTTNTIKKPSNDDIPELEGADVPPVDEYLRAQQQCGKSLQAEHIFAQTMKWLKDIKCVGVVSKQLVEQYAMSVARWIQTEELISEYGFLAKHPTTGQAIASPYVLMSQNYMKQVNQLWYQIYQIVKERCSEGILEETDDPMERLLRAKGG